MGTTIGGTKSESVGGAADTAKAFKQLYAEKTNNEWVNRDSFVKYPNKFFPLEIDYGDVSFIHVPTLVPQYSAVDNSRHSIIFPKEVEIVIADGLVSWVVYLAA